jgi:hypothetical protein
VVACERSIKQWLDSDGKHVDRAGEPDRNAAQ